VPSCPYRRIFPDIYRENPLVRFDSKELYLERKEVKDLFVRATDQLRALKKNKEVELSELFLRKKGIFD
jgi:hypothetical protein